MSVAATASSLLLLFGCGRRSTFVDAGTRPAHASDVAGVASGLTMTEFTPVNRLEELLVRAAADPAVRPDFYRELLRAQVYLLLPDPSAGESARTAETGTTINLVNWDGPSGRFTPMFTSRERVEDISHRTGKVTGFVGIEGRVAFQVLAQHPQQIVLNPGLPYGKQFTAAEIQQLAAGTIFEPGEQLKIAKATRVLLGQPAVYPQALVDALTRRLRERPSVDAAYLAQIHFPDEPTLPHPVVGIVSSDYASDVREVGLVAGDAVGDAGPVDFVDMRGSANETVAKYLRENSQPFYERAVSKQ